MNLSRTIAFNSGILLAGTMIPNVVSIFVSILVVKHLGIEDFGKFSIVQAYLSFFMLVPTFGMGTILIREIARDASKQGALVNNGIALSMLISVVAIVSSWIIMHVLEYPREIRSLIYLSSASLFFTFGTMYVSLLQVHLRMAYYVVPDLVLSFFQSGAMVLLIFINAPLAYFVILQMFIIAPKAISYMYFSNKLFSFKFKFRYDIDVWRLLIRESWPIFMSSLLVMITLRIDQILIFRYIDVTSLGQYSAIVKLTESLNLIPTIVMTSLYPVFCSSSMTSREAFRRIYNMAYKYLSVIVVPIACGTTILSKDIIAFIYGGGFIDASLSFAVLIWSSIFVFLGTVLSNIIIASGLQKYNTFFSACGAVANIVLNLMLIPRYGIVGASIASVLSYGGIGPFIYFLFKEIRPFAADYYRSLIKPLLCSLPMSAFLFYTPSLPIASRILIGAVIYVCGLLLIRFLDKDDYYFIRQLIGARYCKNRDHVVS